MSNRVKRNWVLGAGLATVLLAAGMQSAMAAPHYGECKVTGKWASHPFKPVIPGQLTVEVNMPAPGWWNGNSPDTIKSGYEYCMAANIAYRAGIPKVKVKNVAWDGLVAGQTKNFDLALSEISITPQRKKVVDFSVPYFESTMGVLVRKGEHVTSGNIRDKLIGVEGGSTGASFVTDKIKPMKPARQFSGEAGLFTALAAHQIQVAVTDTSIVLAQQGKSHGRLVVVGQYDTGETYGALYPKGSKNEKVMNTIIESLIKDGTLKKLGDKYLAAAWGASPNSIPTWKLP
ncbi:ABC transporter substrate-binding protein [Acidihalobacter aeolianus]|uniref:ABC transporter substrate-binding protein n=1 Tax=Acidihalobacter aeolianus TaxID=2792603 RepID=A0A1D8K660_9GAMM|nr:ABC transporter substrate-binding protein [Acidihalobacter aeolianus]AOV16449.1 ABC transporter substrate-binding protein [Acidihalobacter aeolianus]